MDPVAVSFSRKGEYPYRFRPKKTQSVRYADDGLVNSHMDDASLNSGLNGVSNLYRFLQHTTPRVPSQPLLETSSQGLCAQGSKDCQKNFFSLNNLWDTFDEWSAYGAGVPILLNSRETVMQYYVPYLSGIQLYSSAESGLPFKTRQRLGDDSDGSEVDYRDSNSETCSSDGEIDRGSDHAAWSSLDVLETIQPGEALLFEYFESAAPSHRVPLFDKVRNLAGLFTGMKTLCSNDISESSWLCVAWYPIYRIPMGPTLKDLSACFLTYHSLSTACTGSANDLSGTHSMCGTQMLLHPFGFSGYKFRGPVWSFAGSRDRHQTTALLKSADDWLQRLHVRHPDFDYFMSHFTPNHH